jgi:hypothetical protein
MSEIENLKLRGGSMAKPPIGIVPMHPLKGVARVFEDSAIKYAPGNYMAQGIEDAIEAYDSAELRHRLDTTPLSGLVTPESYATLDPDSGLPHIFHRIADLLIVATLMIRDGVIEADPGQGKRKRAVSAPAREPESSLNCRCMSTPIFVSADEIEQERIRESNAKPLIDFVHEAAARFDERPLYRASIEVRAELDPDAERRAQGNAHVEALKREQEALAEAKRRHECRCLTCNGRGKIYEQGLDYDCNACKGTGQRTGAEGVRW